MRIPYVITGIALSPADVQDAMDATTYMSEKQIRRYDIPPLMLSGVVYERERRRHPLPNVERFQTALDAYALGHADCDGLAPYRAGELLSRGIAARARVIPSPGVGYHIIVEREGVGGSTLVEDPSAWLGMIDGVDRYDDDPERSAQVRRTRRGRAFMRKAFDTMKKAASAYGSQKTQLLRAALAESRHAEALLSRSGRVEPSTLAEDDA